ncbi:unnamed protein product, partial [Chrysoparadoxa australica]
MSTTRRVQRTYTARKKRTGKHDDAEDRSEKELDKAMQDMVRKAHEEGKNDPRAKVVGVFNKIDCDGDGRITNWELERYLAWCFGLPFNESFELTFPGPDIGMHLRMDSYGDLYVASKDEDSLACDCKSLMVGMRLLAMNGSVLTSSKSALKDAHNLLEEMATDDQLVLRLQNPQHIIRAVDKWLDLNVSDKVYEVEIKEGVYNTKEDFAATVQKCARHQHKGLRTFDCTVHMDAANFTLTADGDAVSLLFGTGTHAKANCSSHFNYNMEEGREDTLAAGKVTTPMWTKGAFAGSSQKGPQIDLGGLREGALGILATDLMNEFDENKSQLVDFEEFVNMHQKYFVRDSRGRQGERLKRKLVESYMPEEKQKAFEVEVEAAERAAERKKHLLAQ